MANEAAKFRTEGERYYKSKRYKSAVEAFTQSLEMEPDNAFCLERRSGAYFNLACFMNEALEDALRCIDLAPGWGMGYWRAASVYKEMEQWDSAVSMCRRGYRETKEECLITLLQQVKNAQFFRAIEGKWYGKVNGNDSGLQEIDFKSHKQVHIEAMGQVYEGPYTFDALQSPIQIDIPMAVGNMLMRMKVKCITKVEQDTLLITCPDTSPQRPTTFEGDGLTVLRRTPVELVEEEQEIMREESPVSPGRSEPEGLASSSSALPRLLRPPSSATTVVKEKLEPGGGARQKDFHPMPDSCVAISSWLAFDDAPPPGHASPADPPRHPDAADAAPQAGGCGVACPLPESGHADGAAAPVIIALPHS